MLIARYREILESMDEGYCLIELIYNAQARPVDYRFIEANSAFERQSGLAGVVGKTILDCVPDFETNWFDTYHQVAITGEPLHFTSEFKSMGYWFDVRVSRADTGGRIAILFKDITAKIKSEAELQASLAQLEESERRFRSMFDSIDEGFCVVDVQFDAAGKPNDYVFVQVNPAFSRQTGLENAAGRSVRALIPAIEESWIALIAETVRTGQSVRFVNQAAAIGRVFSVYVCRMGGADSTLAAVVFTDISERTVEENDLRRVAADLSESDRKKNEFLATLAHELRNPLAPLSNGLHLLERMGHDPSRIAKTVDMMKRQVGQMVHLVNDLLDVARISTGKVELKRQRIDVQAVLQLAMESSKHLIAEKEHRLSVSIPGELIMIDGDLTRIAQMVSNLLNNAAKYTPPGGHIQVTVQVEGPDVAILVEDNGIGVALLNQNKVFDMFTQVDHTSHLGQGGLGIGLSLVRKLAELHGGRVAVASAGTGTGSVFSIYLPLPSEQPGSQQLSSPGAAVAESPGEALRMLIVDDNEDAATSLAMLLELDGHTVQVAFDGLAGLACAKTSMPQFIFLDIGLPGLNGYELVRAMRKTAALEHVPIVALTGWGTDHDKQQAASAGFSSHITKPAQIAVVRALVKTLLTTTAQTS